MNVLPPPDAGRRRAHRFDDGDPCE